MERALIPTADGYVHLRFAGEPARHPTVVLIHQSPSSSRMWIPVMRLLAPSVRTCAVDLLGYGESDPPSRQLSLEGHTRLVLEALRTVVDGPLVVVGHHTGAVMAAKMAAIEPTAVEGLLLSGYPLYPDWRTKLSRLGPALKPAVISHSGAELLEIWHHVTGPLEEGADDQIALTIMADRLRAGREWFTGYVQLIGADLARILRDAADAMRERPTAVLTADRDPLRDYTDAVAAHFDVEPTTIEGTSWVTFEHPEHVADPIAALASRVQQPR